MIEKRGLNEEMLIGLAVPPQPALRARRLGALYSPSLRSYVLMRCITAQGPRRTERVIMICPLYSARVPPASARQETRVELLCYRRCTIHVLHMHVCLGYSHQTSKKAFKNHAWCGADGTIQPQHLARYIQSDILVGTLWFSTRLLRRHVLHVLVQPCA